MRYSVQEGNIKKARQCFEAALVACETHAAAYHGWGQLELSVRRFDAARQVLLKGIKMTKAKPNPHLYAALANLAIRTGMSYFVALFFALMWQFLARKVVVHV